MKKTFTKKLLTTLTCLCMALGLTACGGINIFNIKCAHTYDNACDTTCNKCEETRTITHTPEEDDGDCTTEIKCSVCGTTTTEAKAAHTPEADDGNCLTARNCTVCEQVAVASYTEHTDTETDDDWTCDNPGCEHLFPGTLNGLVFTPNEDGESYYVTGLASDFEGTELTIPATVNGKPVTAIGEGAFNHAFYCGFLSVTIPASVTTIGENAFIGCFILTNIYYGGTDVNTWETLSANAEIRSKATVYFYSSDMPTAEGNYWCYDTKGEPAVWKVALGGVVYQLNNDCESYTVTGLASDFESTELTIPATVNGKPVTAIGYRAFYSCTALASVTIPASVTTIGIEAFFNCTALTSVTFGENSKLKTIGDSAFFMTALASVTIPASVTTIGNYAFSWTALKSVTIPASVTTIGGYAFGWCLALTSVTFGANSQLKTIDYYAFQSCTALASVTIPASVTTIGGYAFQSCTALTSIYYGGTDVNTWKKLSANASIRSEATVYFYYDSETPPTTEGNYWHYVDGVPTAWEEIKSLAFTEIKNEQGEVIGYAVTGIGECTDTDIVIPATYGEGDKNYPVTAIGESAFQDCSSLTSVTIPDSVTEIGMDAFSGCLYLTSVTFEENSNLETIGANAFCNTALTSITIPASVKTIDASAFLYCPSLSSVTFEEGSKLQKIGDWAFASCSKLTSITIPASVKTIGKNAFDGCSKLESVYYDGTDEATWETLSANASIHTNPTVYFYSEEKPTTEGNYWHYDANGVPTTKWDD